ncbi:unnamed protein product [Moneuplotes crassus]|uniref:Uncharacterized protein n=1 Tax=Euplotes crassus TaxID=5936 RepID=A0AAD2CZN9_EUPCR|nr:unnamed protein product [Moneuplotes crassus]
MEPTPPSLTSCVSLFALYLSTHKYHPVRLGQIQKELSVILNECDQGILENHEIKDKTFNENEDHILKTVNELLLKYEAKEEERKMKCEYTTQTCSSEELQIHHQSTELHTKSEIFRNITGSLAALNHLTTLNLWLDDSGPKNFIKKTLPLTPLYSLNLQNYPKNPKITANLLKTSFPCSTKTLEINAIANMKLCSIERHLPSILRVSPRVCESVILGEFTINQSQLKRIFSAFKAMRIFVSRCSCFC